MVMIDNVDINIVVNIIVLINDSDRSLVGDSAYCCAVSR